MYNLNMSVNLFYIKNIGFAISLKTVLFTKSITKISKLPGLTPPLISFYLYNDNVVPVYNLGHFFNENNTRFVNLIFLTNSNRLISFAADDLDMADKYSIESCKEASSLSFVEKDNLLIYKGKKHFIIDSKKVFYAKELLLSES